MWSAVTVTPPTRRHRGQASCAPIPKAESSHTSFPLKDSLGNELTKLLLLWHKILTPPPYLFYLCSPDKDINQQGYQATGLRVRRAPGGKTASELEGTAPELGSALWKPWCGASLRTALLGIGHIFPAEAPKAMPATML